MEWTIDDRDEEKKKKKREHIKLIVDAWRSESSAQSKAGPNNERFNLLKTIGMTERMMEENIQQWDYIKKRILRIYTQELRRSRLDDCQNGSETKEKRKKSCEWGDGEEEEEDRKVM